MLHMRSTPANKASAKAKRDQPEEKEKKAAYDRDIYYEKGGQEKQHFKYHNMGGQQKMYEDYHYKGGNLRSAAYYFDKLKPQREAATRARNIRHGLPEDVSTPNLHQMQYWW